MSFFSAAQLFGDNAGYGTQVPISLSNPAGYGAANRGIGFGEQLTSAIANRSHYALALNTDDLNTRLALFETGGLDASYDQGVVAVAGGGRTIIKDGGAVETISTLGVMYGDDISNAHFRANAFGDTNGGGGFEHVFSWETINPAYGFLTRGNYVPPSTFSTIAYSELATLNPGGIGGDLLRFTSATAYTGTETDLALQSDLVQISGAATAAPNGNGLYYIYSLGPTAADFHLRRLDGTTPVFVSGTAVSIRIYRFSLMSPMRGPSFGAALAASGLDSDDAVLALFSNDLNGRGTRGPGTSIAFVSTQTTGAADISTRMSGAGQMRSTLSSLLFGGFSDAEMRQNGGLHNLFFDHSLASAGSHEVGMIFKDASDTPTSRAAVENWQRITETTVLGIQPSINGTFAAPAGRILLPDSDGTPAAPTGLLKWTWSLAVLPGVTVIEMLTGANAGEYYLMQKVVLTGTGPSDTTQDEIFVTDLDGNTSSLPTAGSFTFRFISRDVLAYKMPASQLKTSPDTGVVASDPVAYGHVLGTQRNTATHNRAVGFAGDLAGIVIDETNVAGDHYLQENWVLGVDGSFYTAGRIRSAGVTLTTDSTIAIPTTSTVIHLDLSLGMSEEDATGTPYWRFDRTNQRWELITLGGGGDSALYIPITFSGLLRQTYVQAFAGSGSLHSVLAALRIQMPAWGTPGTPPTVTNANEATIVFANGAWGEGFISHGGGSGTTISHANSGYSIRIRGQRVGDLLQAVKCSVDYGSIGPGGMGT